MQKAMVNKAKGACRFLTTTSSLENREEQVWGKMMLRD